MSLALRADPTAPECDRLVKQGAHDKAHACYRLAIDRLRGGDARERLAVRIDYAGALERAGQYPQARNELDGTLTEADRELGPGSVEAADALRRRGWVAYRLGNYAAAERSEEHTSELQSPI